MPLIQLIVLLIVIGLILWLVETMIPMDPAIKQIVRVVIVIAVIIWLLALVGLIPAGNIRIGLLERIWCGGGGLPWACGVGVGRLFG